MTDIREGLDAPARKSCPSCGRTNSSRKSRCLYCGSSLLSAGTASFHHAAELAEDPVSREPSQTRYGVLTLLVLAACLLGGITWNYFRLVQEFTEGKGGIPVEISQPRWVQSVDQNQVYGSPRLRPPTFWETFQILSQSGPVIVVTLVSFLLVVVMWYRHVSR
jgi:hypothetical protein